MARFRNREQPGRSGKRPGWEGASTANHEDQELMAAYLRKEPDAAAALYDRFASRVYGLGLVLFRNNTDAEELVQDTFLKLLRAGSKFDPARGSLDVWVMLIARSLAFDVLRRRTLETRIFSSQSANTEASNEPGPEQLAVHRDLVDRARRAIDALPPKQRAAVRLNYFDEASSSRVAELEGVPLGTAKSRIRQGIITLRGALSDGETL